MRTVAEDITYQVDDRLIESVSNEDLSPTLLAPLDERSLQTLSNALIIHFLGPCIDPQDLPAVTVNLFFPRGPLSPELDRLPSTPARINKRLQGHFNSRGPTGLANARSRDATPAITLNAAGANASTLGHEVAHIIMFYLERMGVSANEMFHVNPADAHAHHGPMFRHVHMRVMEALGVPRAMFMLETDESATPIMSDDVFEGHAGLHFRNCKGVFQWPNAVLTAAHANAWKNADQVAWEGETVGGIKKNLRRMLRPVVQAARKAGIERPEYQVSEALQRPLSKGGSFLRNLTRRSAAALDAA